MNKIIGHLTKTLSAINDPRRKRRHNFGVWIAMVLMVFAGWGCSTPSFERQAPSLLSDQQTVLVLPFVDLTQIYGETGMLQCPICPNYFAAGHVSAGAVQFMTEQLVAILESNKTLNVIIRDRPTTTASISENVRLWGHNERQMLVEAGRSAAAQIIITGYIYRFQQRVGKSYAAESPASVAFSLHMLDASSGADKWYGTVDETQAALSEDLFQFKTFIERKGSWVTVEKMAASGLERLLGGGR